VISAGETLPASVYRAWREQTGIEILDGLGSTEIAAHLHFGAAGSIARPE